jgi:hypothetical protein
MVLLGWLFGVIVLVILVVLLRNRALFGNWSPFSPPDRIEYAGRRYYQSSTNPKALLGYKKTILSLKWHPGRIDYSGNPWIGYVPTVVFLDIGNNTYITYVLSGGP